MSKNFIVHNDRGPQRYLDFISLLPEFMREETDVVTLLQVMSDYLNNAYRNTTVVQSFRISLLANDLTLNRVEKQLNKLRKIFIESGDNDLPILFLSKPSGNAIDSNRPLYIEKIKTESDPKSFLSELTTTQYEDGDIIYITFVNSPNDSGEYVIHDGSATKSSRSSSQDPFLNTENEPFTNTHSYLSPRCLEFKVKDTGLVNTRRVGDTSRNTFEVFLETTINSIQSIDSTFLIDRDDKSILIDYFKSSQATSTIDNHFSISFIDGRNPWTDDQLHGIFYARDLSQFAPNPENKDPLFNNSIIEKKIASVNDNGHLIELTLGGVDCDFVSGSKVTLRSDDKVYHTQVIRKHSELVIDVKVGADYVSSAWHTISMNNLFFEKEIYDVNLTRPIILKYKDAIIGENDELTKSDKLHRIEIIETDLIASFMGGLHDDDHIPMSEGVEDVLRVGDYCLLDPLNAAIAGVSPTPHKIIGVNKREGWFKLDGIDFSLVENSLNQAKIKLIKIDRECYCTVKSSSINTDTTGTIIADDYKGDLLTNGYLMRFSNNPAIISLDNNIESWATNKIYKQGDLVSIYDTKLSVYECTSSTERGEHPQTSPNKWMLNMIGLFAEKKAIVENEFMVGPFKTESLSFTEDVESEVYKPNGVNPLYIKQNEDKSISIGFDQRSFFFNPRAAEQKSINRNGYIEVITNGASSSDIVNINENTIIDLYSTSPLPLKDIINTTKIKSIHFDESKLTIITSKPHGLVSGMYVKILSGDDDLYGLSNTIHPITVNTTTECIINGEFSGIPEYILPQNARIESNDGIYIPSTIGSVYNNKTTIHTTHKTTFVDNRDIVLYDNIGNKYDVHITNTFDWNPIFGYGLEVEFDEQPPQDIPQNIYLFQKYMLGDIIKVSQNQDEFTNGVYVISSGEWKKRASENVTAPFTIFTQTNLFTVNEDNPIVAHDIGGSIVTGHSFSISPNGKYQVGEFYTNVADYVVGESIILIGSTNGVIDGVYPIADIDSGSIKINFSKTVDISSVGGNITITKPLWYKYTAHEISWQRQSKYNGSLYSTSIYSVESIGGNRYEITTTSDHDLRFGDPLFIEYFSDVTYKWDILENQYKVTKRISNRTFEVSGKQIPSNLPTRCVRGVILTKNTNSPFINNHSEFVGIPTINRYAKDGELDTIKVKDGDIVVLMDQYNEIENGKYRVNEFASWNRLDDMFVAKIGNLSIDAELVEYPDMCKDDTTIYKYRMFTNSDVSNELKNNDNVYTIDASFIRNFSFVVEHISGFDTMGNRYREYDSRRDIISTTDTTGMKAGFVGIEDMSHSLIEKIERLVYLKDPSVIDFDVISHLARYMGYDLNILKQDIDSSTLYGSKEERELILRRFLHTLPKFYTLGKTKAGLNVLLLAFGIIGDMITLWTPEDNPYNEFIRENEVEQQILADMKEGKSRTWIPTTYFDISVDVEGNVSSQLQLTDFDRVVSAINRWKPINVVFNSMYLSIKSNLEFSIDSVSSRKSASLALNIGYDDIDFDNDGDEVELSNIDWFETSID